MYIIRLKKKWNKGAPTGACSFYVMRNLWTEIRVILACLVLVKVYFWGRSCNQRTHIRQLEENKTLIKNHDR